MSVSSSPTVLWMPWAQEKDSGPTQLRTPSIFELVGFGGLMDLAGNSLASAWAKIDNYRSVAVTSKSDNVRSAAGNPAGAGVYTCG